MEQKSVSDLIFDKFAGSLVKDDLFRGISAELDAFVCGENKKRSKTELQNILKKKQNENSKSEN